MNPLEKGIHDTSTHQTTSFRQLGEQLSNMKELHLGINHDAMCAIKATACFINLIKIENSPHPQAIIPTALNQAV